MTDTWSKDSTLSVRTNRNASDGKWNAVAVLADVQMGAFVGRETMEEIERSIECLTEAKRLAEARWTEFLTGQHQEIAA